MLCENPYMAQGMPFGCGQCLPCRLNRARIWAHRIVLEAALYKDNCFATLTYRDDCLPPGRSLSPDDLQKFLKRLRRRYEPRKFRFFAVGEYGDQSDRPHYHAAFFNFPTCVYGRSRYSKLVDRCCPICDAVTAVWGKGHVYLGTLQRQSAGYLAGYVVKKMTSKDDVRLHGRHPEFTRQSNRPGVAAAAMDEIARIVTAYPTVAPDVPGALDHSGKSRPLGRYLMRQLRKKCGRDEKAPKEILDRLALELLPLRQAAFEASTSFKKAYVDAIEGRLIQVKHRSEIYKTRRVL